jgi:methylase of polypeptide subunit release factors
VEKAILKEVEEEVKRRDFARREGRMEGVSYADDEDEFVPYRAQVSLIIFLPTENTYAHVRKTS